MNHSFIQFQAVVFCIFFTRCIALQLVEWLHPTKQDSLVEWVDRCMDDQSTSYYYCACMARNLSIPKTYAT